MIGQKVRLLKDIWDDGEDPEFRCGCEYKVISTE